MITFKQNNEITYDDKDLMEENSFIGAEIEKTPIPFYGEIKDKLPQPVWENHEDYIDCYWKVWEIAFKNLYQPKENTGREHENGKHHAGDASESSQGIFHQCV